MAIKEQQVSVKQADAAQMSGDLFVVPSTSSGTFGSHWARVVDSWRGKPPSAGIGLGAVAVTGLPRGAPFRALGFAASVDQSEPVTAAPVVEDLGAALARLTQPPDSYRRIVTPALGAGVGGLGIEASFTALVRGFSAGADPDATLVVVERSPERFERLQSALNALASPASVDPDAPPAWMRFAPDAVQGLERAEGYRLTSGANRVHMEHLVACLAGILDQDPTTRISPRGAATGAGLMPTVLEVIRDSVRMTLPPSVSPASLSGLPPLSGHVVEALVAAGSVVGDDGMIGAGDVLTGALTVNCSVTRALSGRLGGPPVARLVSPAADTVPDRNLAAADRLELAREVDMLASVAIAQDTSPPLAIGLHGEWGSGKSFFMAMMRERIETIAGLARDDDELAKSYCRHIRQIHFNAWHYADGNLWASLAATIFDGLAESPEDPVRRAKADQLGRASQGVVAAQDQVVRASTRLRDAQADAGSLASVLRSEVPEVVRSLAGMDSLEKELHAYALGAGLDARGRDFVAVVSEAGSLWDRLRLCVRVARVELTRKRVLPAITGVVFLAVAVTVFALLSRSPLWGSALGVVAGALAGVGTVLGWALRLLHLVRSARRRREKPVRTAERDLAEAREAERGALAEYSARQEELSRLQDRGQRLYDLVRSASSEYREQLSMMSQLRKDFELLAQLLGGPDPALDSEAPDPASVPPAVVAAAAAELTSAQSKAEGDASLQVDRIVLYIDDLDRCPADVVVKVLRAVNLLLSFKLFVVVIAVDGRWLEKSLRARYKKLLQSPQAYLEKIIQLPFVLRPMSPTGYASLVGALVPDPGPVTPTAPARPRTTEDLTSESADEASSRSDAPEQTSPPPDAGPRSQPTSVPTSAVPKMPRPESLAISPDERTLLAGLGPVISTPRTAKRLVNTYRMLRVNADDGSGAGFGPNGGDYRVVILLLAVLIGCPEATDRIFRAWKDSPETQDAWTALPPDLEVASEIAALRLLQPAVGPVDVGSCNTWVPVVSRFRHAHVTSA
jgi:hypothetical protein